MAKRQALPSSEGVAEAPTIPRAHPPAEVDEVERILRHAEDLHERIQTSRWRGLVVLSIVTLLTLTGMIVVMLTSKTTESSVVAVAVWFMFCLGGVQLWALFLVTRYRREIAARDERILNSLVDLLDQIERTGEIERLRSPTGRAEFRIRFSRFNVARKPNKQTAEPTVDDAKAYFEATRRKLAAEQTAEGSAPGDAPKPLPATQR